jgi:putative ABC transport system ATP-binding protein
MALLQELNDAGITIVLVTHEPDIADYASRCVVLRDGEILSDIRQTPRRADVSLAAQPIGAQAGRSTERSAR